MSAWPAQTAAAAASPAVTAMPLRSQRAKLLSTSASRQAPKPLQRSQRSWAFPQAMWRKRSLSFPAQAPKAMLLSALTTVVRKTARQQCCSAARATWIAVLPALASATVQMPASLAR